ncbi:hypothetical protein E4U41_005674 [Claviceps citrina]|nr:hypothetical protein E4U41_005674 [Claviceps citrina]
MSVTSAPAGGGGDRTSFRHGSFHSRCEAAPPLQGSRPASVKLSSNALRLGESFDTIKLDVGLLAWHVGHFPSENDTKMVDKVSEDDLYAILELSQNIGTNVGRIFALRNQHRSPADVGIHADDVALSSSSPNSQQQLSHGGRPECMRRKSCDAETNPRAAAPTKRQRSPSCRTCSTDHTPKWRNGPAGPGTLCNVCGLIYAKRRGRVRGRLMRQPSSC